MNANPERDARAAEFYERFQAFQHSADPMKGVFATQLASDGYRPMVIPLSPHRTTHRWRGIRVHWRNLQLDVREPEDGLLLICHIVRLSHSTSMNSPLLSLGSFLRYAVHRSDIIQVIGGCVTKVADANVTELSLDRLRDFYVRLVGDLLEHPADGMVWMFGITRDPQRYETHALWNRKDTSNPLLT